ncbi:MAG TPA: SDR family NAD(P)-dependent oxidoreductase [Pirellulales bacterium]|jgi:NAD(P)-dependent dehydrogenase (short-subunit alcohol dehydrogenase family)|nr:SDR family NAD(P)-dependent oxidoreductase [Pirellulales bacterium]
MGYWEGKAAVVTGGSSGLGRAIAAALAAAGARVAIASRGADALMATAADLSQGEHEVLALPADVTRQDDVDRLFGRALDVFGRLDLLANAAGRSMRRAVLETTSDDFRELMELNLLGLVRCCRAAAPHLEASHGHLVNIGSLAGKSAARFLGAYPATKFAVSAYTQQLRLELGPNGVHVLLVCPGPIARDAARSESERVARGDDLAGLPPSAHLPGAGVRTRVLPPDKLAAAILRACERRKAELVFPASARLLFALLQLSPRLGDWIVRQTT